MRPLLLAACLLLAAAGAQAQYVCPTTVAAPAYGYGYAAGTYAASYAPSYVPQKVVAQNLTVAPLIVTVPVDSRAVPAQAFGAPYYYSVTDAYQTRNVVRDVVRDELRAYTATQPAPTAKTPPPPAAAPPPPATAPPPPPPLARERGGDVPPPPPQPALPPAAGDDALNQKVLAIFEGKANCVNCHGPQGKNAFKLVDADGQLLPLDSARRWQVYGMVSAGAMPPQAAKDKDAAVDASLLPDLIRWAAQK